MEPFYRAIDYDQVSELTWENGQVGFQGLVPATSREFTWETTNDTLESVVQQGSAALFNKQPQSLNINLIQNSAANINSCSSFPASSSDNHPFTCLESGLCNIGVDCSVSACGTNIIESEMNTMAGTTEEDLVYNYGSDDKKDDHEIKGVKGHSSSTMRSRTAAVHNQSERKRRDRINQKMKILQRLVPNASKTDKASMLGDVIEYLKNLQAQIQMMNYIRNMPQMMVPLGMQQQQQQQMQLHSQLSLLARTGMHMNLAILGTEGMKYMMDTPRPMLPKSDPVPHQFFPSTATSTNPSAILDGASNDDDSNTTSFITAYCSQQANKTTATQENNPTLLCPYRCEEYKSYKDEQTTCSLKCL